MIIVPISETTATWLFQVMFSIGVGVLRSQVTEGPTN